MSRISRQVQLTLGAGLLAAVFLTVTISHYHRGAQLESQMRERALMVTHGLAYASDELLASDAHADLRQIVHNYATFPAVSALAVVNPDCESLAHYDSHARVLKDPCSVPALARIIDQTIRSGGEHSASMEIADNRYWATVVPLAKSRADTSRWGAAVSLLDIAAMSDQQGYAAVVAIVSMTLVIAILLGLLGIFIRTRIMTPINQLSHAIERSKETGTLSPPTLLPNSELARLADSFMEVFEEMHRARREAETASRSKSAFLATMSHEIRTPMNAVVGMTSLLLETELTQEQREFVTTIREGGDALLNLINNILDFSKIEAGGLELENEPYDVRLCIESAIDLVATEAARKGLELGYQLAPDVPPVVLGDISRMRQVLLNLLSNGVKFTATGSVAIKVALASGDGTSAGDASSGGAHRDARLILSVRDTGIGIPPSRKEHIFGSFKQVNASTTREYGGTGLGLAICKRLVEAMEGQIWFDSRQNGGTAFHISVPLRVVDIEDMPESLRRGASHGGFANAMDLVGNDSMSEVQPLRERHLLVIAAHEVVHGFIVAEAESWGMMVQAVRSVAEACDVLDRGELFDVVVLDTIERDGVPVTREAVGQLVRCVRDKALGDAVGLVALMPFGSEREPLRQLGFDQVLPKPVRSASLRGAFERVLGNLDMTTTNVSQRRRQARNQEDMLRVLVVEDNMVNQKVAVNMLAREGLRADVVANGQEAVVALCRQYYDIVLMDVQMPVLDGIEATARIRRMLPEDEQPYIVAMTASTLDQARQRYEQAGMDDFVG